MIAKHIGAAIRALAPGLSAFAETMILLAGATLIAYGAWQAYPPAGPVVGGILILAGTILRARGG